MGLSAAPETPAKEIIWKSERLKNSRVYGFLPLAMQQQENVRWQFSRWRILGAEYACLACADFVDHRQQLPPAVYVLIDAIDTTHAPTNCRVMRISGWQYSKSYSPGESYCPF